MNDLGIEELKQLLTFYKQKSSELEFTLLQSELKINKLNAFKNEIEKAEKIKNNIKGPIEEEQKIKKIRSNNIIPKNEIIDKTNDADKENDKEKKSFFKRKSKNKTKS
jgi:hypothetical protein